VIRVSLGEEISQVNRVSLGEEISLVNCLSLCKREIAGELCIALS